MAKMGLVGTSTGVHMSYSPGISKITNRWARGLGTLPAVSRKSAATLRFPAGADSNSAGSKAILEIILDPDNWQRWIHEYIQEELIPAMRNAWRAESARPEHLPQPLVIGKGPDMSSVARKSNRDVNVRTGRMAAGFAALWKDLKTVRKTGDTAVGIGPTSEILSHRLNDYMDQTGGGGGHSNFNTLWYAVEYGTGMFTGVDFVDGRAKEDVGDRWVRAEGASKINDPEYLGAWFFGKDGKGSLWKGQVGFHFLNTLRTRRPREKWISFMEDTFPDFLRKKLKDLGGLQLTGA